MDFLTPEVITLLITTIGAILIAWFQSKGKNTEAKIVDILLDAIQSTEATEVKTTVKAQTKIANLKGILDAKLIAKGFKAP